MTLEYYEIEEKEAVGDFMNMEQMCSLFGTVPQTIRRWCREGKIPHPDFPGSIHERSSHKLWIRKNLMSYIEKIAKEKAKGLNKRTA